MKVFLYIFWGGFSDVYSAASLFCVSVVIMGFYLFSWHTEEGFHRAFCCLPYYFLPCPCCCRDTSLAPRGEFLHDRNRNPIIPAAPLHFPFVSLTISFPSTTTTLPSVTVCQLHSTAPSCLHIAWSKTTNWSFTACSLSALLSLSHRSLPSSHFFFLFFYGRFLSVSLESSWLLLRARQQENAGRRGNEMTRWKTVLSAGNGIATVTMCHGGEATVSFLWRLTFLKRWRLKHRLAALPFEPVVPYPRQRCVNNWPSVRPCL